MKFICSNCSYEKAIPSNSESKYAGRNVACPKCSATSRIELDATAQPDKPPPIPSPRREPEQPEVNSNGFETLVGNARENVEAIGSRIVSRIVSPATDKANPDTWGTVGSVAGAFSGGLLIVGMCFTPMACCAVPVSIAGVVCALFSNDKKLRMIGLIGNSIVLFLSLAIVAWMTFMLADALRDIKRY